MKLGGAAWWMLLVGIAAGAGIISLLKPSAPAPQAEGLDALRTEIGELTQEVRGLRQALAAAPQHLPTATPVPMTPEASSRELDVLVQRLDALLARPQPLVESAPSSASPTFVVPSPASTEAARRRLSQTDDESLADHRLLSAQQILDLYGMPDLISRDDNGTVHWAYFASESEDGETHDFLFADGVVIANY